MTLRDKKPSKVLNIEHLVCPYPVIEAKKALKDMESGQVIEVITDYKPAATVTIPALCEKSNYEFEIVEEKERWRVFIKKS